MSSDLDIRTRQGQIPSEDDLFWPQAMRDIQLGMMRNADWAASGVLALSLVSWSLVAAALAFHAVAGNLWVGALILWSLAALAALRVFIVRRYRYFANSPDSTQQAVMRIARKKIQHLYWAIALWAAGVISLVTAIISENR